MTTEDATDHLWKQLEHEEYNNYFADHPYEYLDLKIKLTFLRGIEEQLDAIRLCLIDMNDIKIHGNRKR